MRRASRVAGLENDREPARAEPPQQWPRCQGLWAPGLGQGAEGSPGLWGAGGTPRRRLLAELASLDQKEESLETPP